MNLFKLVVISNREVDRVPLSANVYGAEAHNYMAARGRPPPGLYPAEL